MALYENPDRYPPTINAANILAESGFDVVIASRDMKRGDLPAAYHSKVLVQKISGTGASSMGRVAAFTTFLSGVVNIARRLRPIAIIAYDMHALCAARLARWRAPGPMLVYHCLDVWETGFRLNLSGLAKALESSSARAADIVVLPDHVRAERFRLSAKLRDTPLVVANAPRLQTASFYGTLRHRLGPMAEHKQIVFRHGVFGPGHALERTVESMRVWPEESLLVLMGWAIAGFREHLMQLAKSIECLGRLVFVEPVSYPAVREYLSDVDVGLALYDGEDSLGPCAFAGTASNKALEFMAAGVPCVVDAHPASQLYVEEGVAVAANPTDVISIGQAISRLLADEPRRRTMGADGRRLHESVMNFEVQFLPLLELIRSKSWPPSASSTSHPALQ